MTNRSSMPGVTVDEGRVSDFLAGIQGSNRESNRRAGKKAVDIIASTILYSLARHAAYRRKQGRGK